MKTFPKHSKLCGRQRIDALYHEGKKFVCWPLRVVYQPVEGETQLLVWAPKSFFRRAVDRNHLRRLMREAYRLNQDILLGGHYRIAFLYMNRERVPYADVEKAMRKALKKIRTAE